MKFLLLVFFLCVLFGGGGGVDLFCILIYSHTNGIRTAKTQARVFICSYSCESSYDRLCNEYHIVMEILTVPYCSLVCTTFALFFMEESL